jgi:hypothetical protein
MEEMNEAVGVFTRSTSVRRGRPMAQEAYSEFVRGLLELHRRLIELHRSFAHLIKIEQEKEECRIAFFGVGREIPDRIFIFQGQRCSVFTCSHGEQGFQHTKTDEGVHELVNLIRGTAQCPEFGNSPEIANFMMNLPSWLLKIS